MNPFQKILQLSLGDFVAKSLNFFTFVYLARVLGVAEYGVLEFARAILTYLLLLGDGGLEIWATREAARGKEIGDLIGRVVPLRLLLSVAAFAVLIFTVRAFPDYPDLRTLLLLFGLVLLAQGVNLKWVFMGRQRMSGVAVGLLIAQLVFSAAVFALVRRPAAVLWVPVLQLAGELAMATFFLRRLGGVLGSERVRFTLRGARAALRQALTLGASHGLALANFNLDSVLLGLFFGSAAVGWYSAAYKPVTVVLAMPVTYFLGLFPVLSQRFAESGDQFRETVSRSLRLAPVCAFPVGVGGLFLAQPIITLLFGAAYQNSVLPLQILSWSAVLTMLRGTYRHGLNAAGRAGLDLRCAGIATGTNLLLNLLLIPRYGIAGAAVATVASEAVWLGMAWYCFTRYVTATSLVPYVVQPAAAALVMAASLWIAQPLFWTARGCLAVAVYAVTLFLLGVNLLADVPRAGRSVGMDV